MPGVPTKFAIADLVFDQIRTTGPADKAALLSGDSLPFAYLGAIGAALGDFMAAQPQSGTAAPNSPYFQVWLPLLQLFSGRPADGSTPATQGIFRDLKLIRETLQQLQQIVNDEDKFALIDMIGSLTSVQAAIDDLQVVMGRVNGLRVPLFLAIRNSRPAPKVAPSRNWWTRDTLHASRTGRFLKALIEAAATGDAKTKAFALGANVGYAADLCGNPFINSIVNAPYRNHWWRHRFISNFVDTWVHGYHRQGGAVAVGMTGDNPAPMYTTWPNLREARLHDKLALGLGVEAMMDAIRNDTPLPNVLPQALVDSWKTAYQSAYGPPTADSGVSDSGIQSAAAMWWLILWLQTSGEAIPCVPIDQIIQPSGCGARPPWVNVDGSVAVGGGQIVEPPPPSNDLDPDVGEIISGILLAILSLFTFASGNVGAGVAALLGAIYLIADGATEPDWDELRCWVGWVMVFFANLTNLLHDMMKFAGLGFPYTQELAHNPLALPMVTPPDAAIATARSVTFDTNDFPQAVWAALASDWAIRPTGTVETPEENAYPVANTYPHHFVDGLSPGTTIDENPLFALPGRPPLVRDAAEFNARKGMLSIRRPFNTLFGNAVAVSLELINNTQPDELLDWDLYGDPGIGFPTWRLINAADPRSAAAPE